MLNYAAYIGSINVLFECCIDADASNGAIHLPDLLDALVLLLDEFLELSLLVDQAVDVAGLPDKHVTQLSVFRLPLTPSLLPLGSRVHCLSFLREFRSVELGAKG